MFKVYSEYKIKESSYINTLKLIQNLLKDRLKPEFSKIWVQGCSESKHRLSFTIWKPTGEYHQRFGEVGEIKNFNPKRNIHDEIKSIENLINDLRHGILKGVI